MTDRTATQQEVQEAVENARRGVVSGSSADRVILTMENQLRNASAMIYTMSEYLKHPDVRAIPFSVSSGVVADRAEAVGATIHDFIDY